MQNEDSSGQEQSTSQQRIKRFRRSGSVKDGRDFICVYCKKAYLCQGTLVFHVKIKHLHEVDCEEYLKSLYKGSRVDKVLQTLDFTKRTPLVEEEYKE